MILPGRKYQASSTSTYRYSINGQEKSDELNENLTTALYWEYDSRTVRRWNLDPVVKVSESPYLCFDGNPIAMYDFLGDDTGPGPKETSTRKNPKVLETVFLYAKPKSSKKAIAPPKEIQGSFPTAELNKVLNERAASQLRRFEQITQEDYKYVKTETGWKVDFSQRKIDMITSGKSNAGKEVRAILTKALTDRLDDFFNFVDFNDVLKLSITLNNNGKLSTTDLPLPIIGGLSNMLVNNQVATNDEIVLEAAFKSGYGATYSILTNSTAGDRSKMQFIWTSKAAFQKIIETGVIDMSAMKIGTDYIDNSPHPFPRDNNFNQFEFFLVFPISAKSKKSGGQVKQFGVYPVPKYTGY